MSVDDVSAFTELVKRRLGGHRFWRVLLPPTAAAQLTPRPHVPSSEGNLPNSLVEKSIQPAHDWHWHTLS